MWYITTMIKAFFVILHYSDNSCMEIYPIKYGYILQKLVNFDPKEKFGATKRFSANT